MLAGKGKFQSEKQSHLPSRRKKEKENEGKKRIVKDIHDNMKGKKEARQQGNSAKKCMMPFWARTPCISRSYGGGE